MLRGTRSARPASGLSLGPLLGLLLLAPLGHAFDDEPDAPALYLANCARCHGEDGSGQGSETLDRPARSFQLGGFSFGNTEQAVARTLARGIPGSPMPAFELLGEDERLALARHVLSLGPPREEVADADTIMVVGERAQVVRGLLPPISGGAPERTRGLLAGGPDGLSFEYRIDDLRLLGVRAGGFVRRTDWAGRGGTPLQPLGRVVHLEQGGDPPAAYRVLHDDGSTQGLAARLLETRLDGARWSLGASLHGPTPALEADPDAHPLAPDPSALERWGPVLSQVRERAQAFGTSSGAGFTRHWSLRPSTRGTLQLRLPSGPQRERWVDDDTVWSVHETTGADGQALLLVRGVSGLPAAAVGVDWASVRAGPGQLSDVDVRLRVLLLPRWDAELRESLRADLARATETSR